VTRAPGPSLLHELKFGLARRAALAVVLVGIIGTGLHLVWSVRQQRMTQERVREAIAHTLREHVRARDLISIQRTIHAFGLANEGAVVCVRLAGGMVIQSPSCENPSFRAFEVPLTRETFEVSVRVPMLDRMVMAGIPFVFGLFLVVWLVSRYLRRLSGRISSDLELLGASASAGSPVFEELRRAQEKIEEGVRLKEQAIVGQVAAQVAHDIRSPVAALKVAIRALPETAYDSKELIASAISRISAIAEDLLKLKRSTHLETSGPSVASIAAAEAAATETTTENTPPQLVSEIIGKIVQEKKAQHQDARPEVRIDLHVDERAWDAFVAIDPSHLQRIVSNLINNAVEAIDGAGIVTLVTAVRDRVRVEVRDTGRGIPPELLPRLCKEGASFGKEGGNGLGLFHAKTTIERAGGAFGIDSILGHGTQVSIDLPATPQPPHFLRKLVLEWSSAVVVLDDDPSIHRAWRQRFQALDPAIIVETHTDPAAVIERRRSEGCLYLLDQELGGPVSGIDVAERLGAGSRTILVTSAWKEQAVVDRCKAVGILILPKFAIEHVPIEIERARTNPQPVVAV
jgi:signal transduction histidine kinase